MSFLKYLLAASQLGRIHDEEARGTLEIHHLSLRGQALKFSQSLISKISIRLPHFEKPGLKIVRLSRKIIVRYTKANWTMLYFGGLKQIFTKCSLYISHDSCSPQDLYVYYSNLSHINTLIQISIKMK